MTDQEILILVCLANLFLAWRTIRSARRNQVLAHEIQRQAAANLQNAKNNDAIAHELKAIMTKLREDLA